MTREDIIRTAREAGLVLTGPIPLWVAIDDDLERFAALVAEATRKACAAQIDDNAMACENPLYRSLLQANADELRGIESK